MLDLIQFLIYILRSVDGQKDSLDKFLRGVYRCSKPHSSKNIFSKAAIATGLT